MVGLDPQGALDFQQLLKKLSEQGVSIFLSTHSLPVAEALCDRIGVLDRGKLIALGTLAELRARVTEAAHQREPSEHPGAADSLEEIFLDLVGAADGQW